MPDSKVTALTEDTAPAHGDYGYTIDDPTGTPVSKRATWLNILKGAVLGLLTSDGDILTRSGGAAARITRADLAADAAWSGLYAPVAAAGIDSLATFNAFYGSSPTTYDYEFSGSGSTLPSGWAWTNQGTASYSERGTLGTGVLTVPSSSLNLRVITRSLPSESTWTAIAKLRMAKSATNYNGAGLVLRASGSGKILSYALGNDAAVAGALWDSPTAFNAGFGTNQPIQHPDGVLYLRIKRNSATSFDFAWSTDGIVWQQTISAYNPSGFLTADQIGVYAENRSSVDIEVGIDWFRVR